MFNDFLGSPVAEWLRVLFLNHSSHCCVWCRFESGTDMSQASQVLFAGVPGGFSQDSPIFAPPTDWPVSYELK